MSATRQPPDVQRALTEEAQRVEELARLLILDTPQDERFDRITRIAQRMLNVSASLISLVEAGRQWIESRQGINVSEIPHAGKTLAAPAVPVFARDELLRTLSDRVPGMIFRLLFALDGRICIPYASDGIRHIFGLLPADVEYDAALLFDRVHADDRRRVIESLQESARCLQPWQQEFRAIPSGRAPRWLRVDSAPERQPDGTTIWNGYIADVTQQKDSEAKLREARSQAVQALEEVSQLAAIVGCTTNVVMLTDLDGELVWTNPAFTKTYGYSLDEVRGRRPSAILYGPGTDKETAEKIAQHLRRKESLRVEILHYAKDGKECWVDVELQPRTDPSGRGAGFISVATVITERRRAELELQTQSDRLALAALAGGLGVWDWDLRTGTSIWDARASSIYHLSQSGSPHREDVMLNCIHPDDRERVSSARTAALQGECPFDAEYRIVVDEMERDVRCAGVISYGSDAVAARMTGVILDISAQRRVVKLKNELLSTISHELRTPLTSIRGALGLLAARSAGSLPAETLRLIHIAQRNSERLTDLVNDFLDMEKLASGQMTLRCRPERLMPLIETAMEDTSGYAATFDVKLVMSQVSPDAQVNVDARRFGQILANLLSNAVKFSPRGAEVEIIVQSQAEHVSISVRDRGPGISPDFAPRVFQRFSQEDTTDTRAKGGTGLGLAISRTLAEQMHGRLYFTPGDGCGTVFTLELPLASRLADRD